MQPTPQATTEAEIDFLTVFRRLKAGISQIIGLALVLGVLGIAIAGTYTWLKPVDTVARVTFSFSGFEKGQYPDKSKFDPDDLRSPDLISQALKAIGKSDDPSLQADLRTGLAVVGIIPPAIAKERDRLRASGQIPGIFVPDEYDLILSEKRTFPLSTSERERFLYELSLAYQKRFARLYMEMPAEYGRVFETLRGSNYFDYEFILKEEIQKLERFLTSMLEDAKTFRSRSTGLSFRDVLTQVELFDHLKVDNVLSIIYASGLTDNRETAMTKLNYQLTLLISDEQQLQQEQRVVTDLLEESRHREQSYVVGAKAQMEPSRPAVDPSLLDTLVANDAYNFLVKKALKTGFDMEHAHAQRLQLEQRIKHIQDLPATPTASLRAIQVSFDASMKNMETEYDHLIDLIRRTEQDYAAQEYADAVRISSQPYTLTHTTFIIACGLGCLLAGAALGAGLSLIGFFQARTTPAP
jgi:hypothetical protein